MKRSGEHGMITFDQALYESARRGEISDDDALAYADSANEVRLMLKLGDARPGTRSRDMEAMGLVDEV
jgi:twitching motility protein PilU